MVLKYLTLFFLLCFSSTELCAQSLTLKDSIGSSIEDTRDVDNLSKKGYLKECFMQIDFYLKQKNTDPYIFIVDGEVLRAADFEDYRKSIYEQAYSIHFVDSLDTIMKSTSSTQHYLILITTRNSKNGKPPYLGF